MKNFTIHSKRLLLLSMTLLYAPSVLAQNAAGNNGSTGGGITPVTLNNPLQVTSITGLFVALLEILTIFAIPIVVFFIIYAGFLYVTARGNVDQVTRAHRALLYAVIGGLLILGGRVLIDVVKGTVDAVKNSQ